ncbi:MAG: DUF4304 domain-containing protein [Chloroflexi bacterium]|nr:DUF4304 domain-containing protein [Chloroflexota bacterium]
MAKKTALAVYMDEIAVEVHKYLKTLGYRKFGHTYNRETEPGLIQVINLQAAPYFSSLYGLFTVNLSIYIQEADETFMGQPRMDRYIKEYAGKFRERLNDLMVGGSEILHHYDPKSRWWRIEDNTTGISTEIVFLLQKYGQPYLDEYASRQAILHYWSTIEGNVPEIRLEDEAFGIRRIVACILAKQGETQTAKQYLQDEYDLLLKDWHQGRKEYTLKLAQRLGITLDTQ